MPGTDKMVETGRRATLSLTTFLVATIPVMASVHKVNNQLIENMRNVSACARGVRLTVAYVVQDPTNDVNVSFEMGSWKVKLVLLDPVSDVVTKSPSPVSPTSKLTTGTVRFVDGSITKTNAVNSY